jgi:hypothetical protein
MAYDQNNTKRRESKKLYELRNSEKKKEYERQYEQNNKERRTKRTTTVNRTTVNWKTPASVREFFESLRVSLRIASVSDWYRISRPQIYQFGGVQLP